MRKLLREASVFVLPQLVLGLRQGHLRMRFKKKKTKYLCILKEKKSTQIQPRKESPLKVLGLREFWSCFF